MYNQMMRYWTEVLQPYKMLDWSLPNKVVYENKSLRLRTFTGKVNPAKRPVLILAPNAGHHLNICEPLIEKCLGIDADRMVAVVDWIPPTAECACKYDSLNDMIANIGRCVDELGGKVHLFTLCQGAWAGAIYTALNPDPVISYTNAAGPIDFCAGGGKIQQLAQNLPMSFYSSMVNMCGGVHRGDLQLAGFKSMNAYDRYVGDYLDLWYAVCDGDERRIKDWHRFKDWYDQPQNLAGVWYLEAVEKLFKKNMLITGELEILGRKVDLKEIKCPVFLIAGENDDISPAPQVFNMEFYVSGPVSKRLIENAGHIGVFVKASSLKYWEEAIISKLGDIEKPVVARAKAKDKNEHN